MCKSYFFFVWKDNFTFIFILGFFSVLHFFSCGCLHWSLCWNHVCLQWRLTLTVSTTLIVFLNVLHFRSVQWRIAHAFRALVFCVSFGIRHFFLKSSCYSIISIFLLLNEDLFQSLGQFTVKSLLKNETWVWNWSFVSRRWRAFLIFHNTSIRLLRGK